MKYNQAVEMHYNKIENLIQEEIKNGNIKISTSDLNRFLDFESDLFKSNLYECCKKNGTILSQDYFRLTKESLLRMPYRLICYLKELTLVNHGS